MDDKKYFAFISYSHRDKPYAKSLYRKLEHYRLPFSLIREYKEKGIVLPRKVSPVFLDDMEMAEQSVQAGMHSGLERSKFLIVVCSPNSAKSSYVNFEVEEFINSGRKTRIIPYIIDGTPCSGDPETECYPPALRDPDILGADARELKKETHLRIIATMLGIDTGTLAQRDRQRLLKRVVGVSLAIILALSTVSVYTFLMEKQISAQYQDISSTTSGLLLKEGDRLDAIRYALRGLDMESASPKSEKALADALYIYQEPCYRPDYKISQKTGIQSADVSDDGNAVVTLDLVGVLRRFERGAKQETWKTNVGYSEIANRLSKPSVQILEELSAILYLGYSGTATLYSLETGEKLRSINLTQESGIQQALESRKENGSYLSFRDGSQTELYVCNFLGDTAKKEIQLPKKCDGGTLPGAILGIPNGSGFIYLGSLDESDPDGYNQGSLYNLEGKIHRHFSFPQPKDSVFSCLSKDGDKLYFHSLSGDRAFVFSIRKNKLADFTAGDHHTYHHIKSTLTESGVLTTAWDEDSHLHYWIDGKNEVDAGGFCSPEETPSVLSYTVGKNGTVLVDASCFSEKEGQYEKLFLFSCSDNTWKDINYPLGPEGTPTLLALGETTPVFASASADGMIRIYDWNRQKVVSAFNMESLHKGIAGIRFLQNDNLLFLRYTLEANSCPVTGFLLIDIKSGECVYSAPPQKGGTPYSELYMDIKNDRMIAYSANTTAVCLDTNTWEPLFQIPMFACILNNGKIITGQTEGEQFSVFQRPYYTKNDLIALGKNELKN